MADERHEKHASGSPLTTDSSGATEVDGEEEIADEEAPPTFLYRLVKYLGRLHPMAVHFPIAFLLAACAVQWFPVLTARESAASVVTVLLWFGVAGALAAAPLGWAYAYDAACFGDDEILLSRHRWIGTTTAAASLVLLPFRSRSRLSRKGLAVTLTIVAGLVTLAGYFGASLVYGADHLLEF